jgi:hypothetical protein
VLASQLALFATLHDDRRPPAERTASGRYLHPSLFEHQAAPICRSDRYARSILSGTHQYARRATDVLLAPGGTYVTTLPTPSLFSGGDPLESR